ncbi:MAG TPA: hypothetical protein PKD18_23525 [Saprospiraceae bacterium]|nr:hypothetical protein [Saprospiraceae bacterium]
MTRLLIMLFLFIVNFSCEQKRHSPEPNPNYLVSPKEIYKICDSIGAINYFFTGYSPYDLKDGFIWLCYEPMDVVMEQLTTGLSVHQINLFIQEFVHVKSNQQLINLMKKYPRGIVFLDKETSENELETFLCQIEESKIRIYYAGNPPKSFYVVRNEKAELKRVPKKAIPIAEKDFIEPIE